MKIYENSKNTGVNSKNTGLWVIIEIVKILDCG